MIVLYNTTKYRDTKTEHLNHNMILQQIIPLFLCSIQHSIVHASSFFVIKTFGMCSVGLINMGGCRKLILTSSTYIEVRILKLGSIFSYST